MGLSVGHQPHAVVEDAPAVVDGWGEANQLGELALQPSQEWALGVRQLLVDVGLTEWVDRH